jgi:twitching motility protein PilT
MHSITASMASSIAVTQEDPPVEGPVTPAKSEAEVHDPTLDVRAPELRGQIEVLPADTEEPSRVERAVILSVPPPPAEELSIIEPYLAMALANGASDILLVPGRSPLLRVASDLLPKGPAIAPAQMAQLVSAVVPSRLVARLERDGHCNFSIAHAVHGRFRAHVSRQRSGVKITLRAVPREVPTLSSLGLPDTLAHVARMHSGLVLVTGPAGHGKSCTVAALVDLLNGGTHGHIVTIEDPMEHVHSRKRALVSQREVGIHTKSVATGLAAALREDPSVIVVGELTSAEVIRAALAAAESGYLVLATLAATGVARAIDRIIDTFPAGEQSHVRSVLAGVLRLSMGQRLVPSSDRTRLHVAVELLPASVALYSLVRDGKTAQIPGLMQRGKALGIVRLDESLAELARTSKVTLDTAKQYAEVPAELEASVRGKRDEAGKSLAPRK